MIGRAFVGLGLSLETQVASMNSVGVNYSTVQRSNGTALHKSGVIEDLFLEVL